MTPDQVIHDLADRLIGDIDAMDAKRNLAVYEQDARLIAREYLKREQENERLRDIESAAREARRILRDPGLLWIGAADILDEALERAKPAEGAEGQQAARCRKCGAAMEEVETHTSGVCPTHGVQPAEGAEGVTPDGP